MSAGVKAAHRTLVKLTPDDDDDITQKNVFNVRDPDLSCGHSLRSGCTSNQAKTWQQRQVHLAQDNDDAISRASQATTTTSPTTATAGNIDLTFAQLNELLCKVEELREKKKKMNQNPSQ